MQGDYFGFGWLGGGWVAVIWQAAQGGEQAGELQRGVNGVAGAGMGLLEVE
jgi:hypothetical protein